LTASFLLPFSTQKDLEKSFENRLKTHCNVRFSSILKHRLQHYLCMDRKMFGKKG
jgi:hypothetical protein